MGIGSGIVSDSSPLDEWRECLLKARFLTNPPPPFSLLETLLFDPREGYLYLEEHLERLATSADYLGRVCDLQKVRTKLDECGLTFSGSTCMRVRLLVGDDGEPTIEALECELPRALSLHQARTLRGQPLALTDFASQATDSFSPWLFHKTTRREIYDEAWRQAGSEGLIDLIFCNQKGEVTEGAISNIIVEEDGSFFTPPLESGVLPGVMRKILLAAEGEYAIEERVLYQDDLIRADRIYLCNSVRGVVEVELRS